MPTFTAPDGTVFDDRQKYRQYLMETVYTFQDKEGETLQKNPGDVDGQVFNIKNLKDCTVLVLDHTEQIQIDDCNGCKIFLGAVCSSIFMNNCANCDVTVAVSQFRVRDCVDCTYHLYALTEPILESSQGIKIGRHNGAYPQLEQHMRQAGLDPKLNKWNLIFDFSDPDKKGGNWRFLTAEEEATAGMWLPLGPCEGCISTERALPPDTTGAAQVEGMQAFGITELAAGVHQQAPAAAAAVAPTIPIIPVNIPTPEGEGFLLPPQDVPPVAPPSVPAPPGDVPGLPPTAPGAEAGAGGGGGGGDPFAAPPSGGDPPMPPPPGNDPFASNQSGVRAVDGGVGGEMQERARKEQEQLSHQVQKAEEALDKFYDERTDRLAHKQQLNREEQEDQERHRQQMLVQSQNNPWARTLELVDLKDHTDGEVEDPSLAKDRMRKLLVQLKAQGLDHMQS
eukprot:CAMPEP_0113938360 /NCGR_PEP_ID=MMETSP1339-20121228/4809_1 /TAXON_ID=94617 /ORGANISM="Fibrocapsa japonica" /LENGTH=450 /DNA_ID=CAMNT_0000941455 /DNA_START=75 /DNA_END=1428 /DNA_ORIENTATION=- /assembly_acc=CAM_ASM_000762